MKFPIFSHSRVSLLLMIALTLATFTALPYTAQQPTPIPFDESRIISELTNALQLQPEQVNQLSRLIDARRQRIESLQRQMGQFRPGSPEFNQLHAQLDRERRGVMEELLPSLRPEQQAVLRALLGKPAQPGARPFSPATKIAPLKPALPTGAIAAGERLISLPRVSQTRGRYSTDQVAALTEEQKILHLLNRAGFGPRPGDIERVRQLGLDRYLEQQLHPEEMADEFLVRPLNSLGTLQMSTIEIMQNFAPPPMPPRPQPIPTPTPTPTPEIKTLPPLAQNGEPAKGESGEAAAMEASPAMAPAMQQEPKAQPTPTPARSSMPPRDGQLPLRELQQAKLLRAIFNEKQLQEVMVDFWYNHFNVWANKDAARWMVTSYERDVIRPYALGKFKELLVATAQSPAMLYYLDNFLSQAEVRDGAPQRQSDGAPGRRGDGATGRQGEMANSNNFPPSPSLPVPQSPPVRRPGLNENYARELMELHTLGVDGGYTQKDVTEVARCFSGWMIVPQPNTSFVFRPRVHDKGEKIVLGTRIPAGGGIEDGLRVLDILSKHSSTAKFISRKLCQRFVADEPPEPLVDRAATTFLKTEGDIREVLRTILTSEEFYSAKYYRNKIKSPLELAASAIRATGASTDGALPLIQTVARMGEALYLCQPPTGYKEESADWLSSATLLERMNFAVALTGDRINGTRIDIARFVAPEAMKDGRRMLDQLIAAFIHSDVSKETRENLTRVLNESKANPVPAKFDAKTSQKNNEQSIGSISALILGSREFQVK